MNETTRIFPTKARALELAIQTANRDAPYEAIIDRAKAFVAFLDGEDALPSDPRERLLHMAHAYADATQSDVYIDIRTGDGVNETRDARWIRPSS